MALMIKYGIAYGGYSRRGVTMGSPTCQQLIRVDAPLIILRGFITSFKQMKVILLRINKHH